MTVMFIYGFNDINYIETFCIHSQNKPLQTGGENEHNCNAFSGPIKTTSQNTPL
jgi:hypothetical protein